MFKTSLAIACSGLALAACASSAPAVQGPDWQMPAYVNSSAAPYRLGALDVVNVTVFQVPDLSLERAQVDAAGNLQLPLIGVLQARGLSAAELGEEIRRRLAADYLQNPQVSVAVVEAASQKVTVDGAVVEPGVFQMKGNTTLLQAIAMAKGPSRVAELERVAVFRTVDDQRMVALFDLQAIRRGQAQDPAILGDDVIVVDQSRSSALFRDLVATLPALAVFRLF